MFMLYMFYTKKQPNVGKYTSPMDPMVGWVLQHGKLRGMKLVMSG